MGGEPQANWNRRRCYSLWLSVCPGTIAVRCEIRSRIGAELDASHLALEYLSNAPRRKQKIRTRIDLCEHCDTIELWIDPEPNAQLTLIWLLDYLRHYGTIASKLALVQADVMIGDHPPEELLKRRLPVVDILNDHLEIASAAWLAWRAPTPQDWFDLLSKDLNVLPRLQQTVVKLLEELPMRATGLGATEMQMLKLISEGYIHPFELFPHNPQQRRVFGRPDRCWMVWRIVRYRPYLA